MALNHFAKSVMIAGALSLCVGGAAADIVAVVSSKSPVNTLSKDQVADIFLGKTLRFPGGAEAVPIDQEEGSAARNEFYAAVSGKSPAQLTAHWSKMIFTGRGLPPKQVADSIAAKKLVIANPNAISYIDRSLVDGSVRVVLAP
ncbi:MAG TPA: hypothetical protein VIY90_19905 [Steroidobacteraceae bacterium]